MKKLSQAQFSRLLIKNSVNLKSLGQLNFYDKIKIFILRKPYLSVLLKQLEIHFKSIPEEKFFSIVNFFMTKGIIVPFDGNISKYLSEVFSYLCSKYWVVTGDSKTEINKKSKFLYGLYEDLVTNYDRYAESIVLSNLVPIINNLFKE